MGKSSEARGNKRKFGSGKGATYAAAPRRGPPAVFVSCESGREKKCQREALDLLHHYYYASRPSLSSMQKKEAHTTDDDDDDPLSLEEELAMLRRGAVAEEVLAYDPNNSKRPRTDKKGSSNNNKKVASSMKSPFSIYDTGMRGMVCILMNLPESEMVPYDDILAKIRAAKEGKDCKDDKTSTVTAGTSIGTDSKKKESGGDTTKEKKISAGCESGSKQSNSNNSDTFLWDPVETVRCIMRDAKQSNSTDDGESNTAKDGLKDNEQEKKMISPTESPPPGSRFILRMLPMQATCYASVEEVKAISTSLLKRFLPKVQSILSKDDKKASFKLEIKRRLCSHLTQEQIINAVAPVVLEGGLENVMPGYQFSVNLSDPDFSIRIETCRTLCGISILPRESWYKNFNLAELTNPSSTKHTEKS